MMSYPDVMIICSDLPVGKPLHMHIGTAMIRLHIHWHPCQKPKYYKSPEPCCLFPNLISVPVTLSPRYFDASLYQSLIYLHS